ncbi:uncharacterized protein LOC131928646 [Physella acuta]|uniref:uncharacterized protein LOC131928646 n=1 Tax=Physella acuta TaxID=109671 RepID=UPI0027DDE877|nr:uncharacterized protein LOC131928646 [Physella acuta]
MPEVTTVTGISEDDASNYNLDSSFGFLTTEELITDDVALLTMRVLMYFVTPAISSFGVVGNVLSIIVLAKHGMNKSSNILLVNLAFYNIVFLIAFNSVPKIIYETVSNHKYEGYSIQNTYILFVFFSIFTFFDYSFGLMASSMPMLITIERLIVIFFPLSFHRVITPGRTWFVVVLVVVYWVSIFIYTSFWLEINQSIDPLKNLTIALLQNSPLFYDNPETAEAIEGLFVYTSILIPPIFTALGCVVISMKIKSASVKRQALTSKSKSNSRTTKILLAVCVLYVITSAISCIPMFMPDDASYSMTDDTPTNFSKLLYQLLNIVGCINSSGDFVVYIVMNKSFRDTLHNLCSCERRRLVK